MGSLKFAGSNATTLLLRACGWDEANFRSVRYLEVKYVAKRFGTKDSVHCSEIRGDRFSEVGNVLHASMGLPSCSLEMEMYSP